LGYELINPLRERFLEHARQIIPSGKLRLYCARGGLRSHKMAEFLEANGYEVTLLKGGYKSYRNWVLNRIKRFTNIVIVSGYTGCGKTEVLGELAQLGCQVLDLEALANHKGSAFGALGNMPQPGSAQFHNLIFNAIKDYKPELPLWVENESVTIGKVFLPKELWDNMLVANGYEIELPLSERVGFIMRTYGKFDTESLISCIKMLSKRLGDEACRELCRLTADHQLELVVRQLIKYYDKGYEVSRSQKECQEFVKIHFDTLEPHKIARFLKSEYRKNPTNKL
jgi:tRNA 2-selenouridine synthase